MERVFPLPLDTMRLVTDLHKTPEDINAILCTTRGWFEVTTIHKMVLESGEAHHAFRHRYPQLFCWGQSAGSERLCWKWKFTQHSYTAQQHRELPSKLHEEDAKGCGRHLSVVTCRRLGCFILFFFANLNELDVEMKATKVLQLKDNNNIGFQSKIRNISNHSFINKYCGLTRFLVVRKMVWKNPDRH